MDDYAGRVLADRYRLPLPPSDEYELTETRAFDSYSGQEVLVRQVPLPEVVEAEVLDADGLPDGFTARDGARRPASARPGPRRPADPVVRRAVDAAQAAARIPDHPRLDQVFDVFAEGGSLWIVTELVAARPLAALLAEKPLTPYRAAEIASDVLMALRVLHGHGWVHRNLTARTVLVCDDGRVMLTGLAAGAAEEALCGYDPVPHDPDDLDDPEDPGEESGGGGALEAAPGVPGGAGVLGAAGTGAVGHEAPGSVAPAAVDPEAARRAAIEARSASGLPSGGAGAADGGPGEFSRRSADPTTDIRAARAGAIAAYRAGARAAARVQEAQNSRATLPGARPAPDGDVAVPGGDEAAPGGNIAAPGGSMAHGDASPYGSGAVPHGNPSPYGGGPVPQSAPSPYGSGPVSRAGSPRRPDQASPTPGPEGYSGPATVPGPEGYSGPATVPGPAGYSGTASAGHNAPAAHMGIAPRANGSAQSLSPYVAPGQGTASLPVQSAAGEEAGASARWDDLVAGTPAPRRGPATALAAERARQARMAVVGPVTERWAPEQAGPVHENWQLAAPIGPATDLWALGALLFRAVQGHAPYPEESTAELVQMVCAEPPAFAEECGPLRPVVESLLRQDPTERIDFEELGGWLRSLVRSAPEPEAGVHVVPAPPADASRLPVVRRRGELVRRRRAGLPVHHGRHKRAKQERQSPRSLGRMLLVLVLLVVAAAIAYAVLFMPKAGTGGGGATDRTGSAGQAGRTPAQSPEAGGEPRPDRSSPEQGDSADGGPSEEAGSETQTTDGPDVADGFTLRKDPEGFRVAVAKGWERTPLNGRGQVVYSRGAFELVVVPGRDGADEYGSDPMAYQREDEPELQPFRASSWSTSTGLKSIEVGGRSMAEGQFTWTGGDGRELFVRNLAMLVDGRYHVVQVRGPEAERDEVTRLFEQASATYQVTG